MAKQPLPPLYLVVQNVRSMFNVGSLFRTSDAFGVTKIYLVGITATPPRHEISKTALGAELNVPWEYFKNPLSLLRQLRKDGVRIVALETGTQSVALPKYRPRFPLALVCGHEVRGISPAVLRFADDVVSIPMLGEKESLNVSVAAGVALYALRFGSRK
ncbi:MAG: RNA methyltransferase [Patescibacteria group bacterium]|nr:RNA methyltransferase [Patescibacteria group bacterium]